MAEKNEDIKQLFTYLGLNPSDYQEIRTPARQSGAGETRDSARRWALLESLTQSSPPPATPAAPPPTTPPTTPIVTETVIVAAETVRPLQSAAVPTEPAVPPAVAPRVTTPSRELSRAEMERESLQSFFEAVKEPLPPSLAAMPMDGPSLREAVEARVTDRLTAALRDVPDETARKIAELVKARWQPEDSKPAAAAPASAPVRPSAPPAAVESAARPSGLRFNYQTPSAPPATGSDPLADVFRRLAAARRRS